MSRTRKAEAAGDLESPVKFRYYELHAITETLSQNGFHCLFKNLLQALSGNMECNCGRTLSLDGQIEELFNRLLTKSGSQQLTKFN